MFSIPHTFGNRKAPGGQIGLLSGAPEEPPPALPSAPLALARLTTLLLLVHPLLTLRTGAHGVRRPCIVPTRPASVLLPVRSPNTTTSASRRNRLASSPSSSSLPGLRTRRNHLSLEMQIIQEARDTVVKSAAYSQQPSIRSLFRALLTCMLTTPCIGSKQTLLGINAPALPPGGSCPCASYDPSSSCTPPSDPWNRSTRCTAPLHRSDATSTGSSSSTQPEHDYFGEAGQLLNVHPGSGACRGPPIQFPPPPPAARPLPLRVLRPFFFLYTPF